MLDEWAYAKPYTSETERVAVFAEWLHHYNHHRGHTPLKGQPPASRVTNLSRQYIYPTWRCISTASSWRGLSGFISECLRP